MDFLKEVFSASASTWTRPQSDKPHHWVDSTPLVDRIPHTTFELPSVDDPLAFVQVHQPTTATTPSSRNNRLVMALSALLWFVVVLLVWAELSSSSSSTTVNAKTSAVDAQPYTEFQREADVVEDILKENREKYSHHNGPKLMPERPVYKNY